MGAKRGEGRGDSGQMGCPRVLGRSGKLSEESQGSWAAQSALHSGMGLSPEPKDSSQCRSSKHLGQEQSGRPSCGRWHLMSWSKHRQQVAM